MSHDNNQQLMSCEELDDTLYGISRDIVSNPKELEEDQYRGSTSRFGVERSLKSSTKCPTNEQFISIT